jgi:hypothetical protein
LIELSGDAMFAAYAVLLMLSGVLMIILGAAIGSQSKRTRVLSIIFGAGFFGYGFYLLFLFQGGSYFVFYYAFIVPILFVVQAIQARRATKAQMAAQPPLTVYPPAVGFPAPQGQPPAQPGHPAPQAQPEYPSTPGYPPAL